MLSESSIVVICSTVVTIATLYFQNKKNAEQLQGIADKNAAASRARAEDLKVAVDGKITTLIQKVEAEGALKVQVAALTATAAGKEEGETKAALAAAHHNQMVSALHEEKIANGKKAENDKQVGQTDRIEKTGDDSNKRIKNVETNTDKRVADVEAKIDTKEDKS